MCAIKDETWFVSVIKKLLNRLTVKKITFR